MCLQYREEKVTDKYIVCVVSNWHGREKAQTVESNCWEKGSETVELIRTLTLSFTIRNFLSHFEQFRGVDKHYFLERSRVSSLLSFDSISSFVTTTEVENKIRKNFRSFLREGKASRQTLTSNLKCKLHLSSSKGRQNQDMKHSHSPKAYPLSYHCKEWVHSSVFLLCRQQRTREEIENRRF